MQIKEFQSEENAGERIDKFLTEKVPELSRSYIQKLIKEKNVKVNSTVIKSNYKVAKGDQIQITIPDLTEPDILPENIPLDILYEDDDILVVNKPKGMVVHRQQVIIPEPWSMRSCIIAKTGFQESTV